MNCWHRSNARCSAGPESARRREGAFGRGALGHIHNTGVADLTFPREIHDELISGGRAKPHGAGFANVVSYHIRESEDVPWAVELLRMNYDRAKQAAGRRRKA